MQKVIKSLVIVVTLAGGLLVASPRDAECLGCVWTGSCMGNFVCGKRCICVKRSTIDVSGFCAVR